MNLSEFRTRVARTVGMSTAASDDLALIDSWVNEGVVQFLRDTKLNTRLAALSATAGSADYSLDTDILAMQALWYEPSGAQSAVLTPVSPETLFTMRMTTPLGGSSPRYFALSGAHTLMLYPTPASSDDLIHALYVPRPDALAATADSPSATAMGNIPVEYHPAIESYAKWKAGSAEEHGPSQSGEVFKREYEAAVGKARGELVRKLGVVVPGFVPGRPGRFVPTSNGIDY